MKRIFTVIVALALSLSLPVYGFAADDSAEVEGKIAELEKKYGINIEYPTNRSGEPVLTANSLTTLDMALENVTTNVVKQVSKYYQDKNGKKLTFSYKRETANLTEGAEATLAGFDPNRSLIELYFPSSGAALIATGENPISIVHEFGHALHLMYTDQYGLDKMKQEWTAFNSGKKYRESNIMENPDDTIFVSGYAATMFEEDVAETIAHVFVRTKAGQGFKNKLASGGAQTGLGKKVAYVEKMLSAYLSDTGAAVSNYRKIYDTPASMTYQGMKFSGDYLQFAGYPQPRYILNGTLRVLGKEKDRAVWIRSIGGWYVKDTGGNEIIVFPGGTWCDVGRSFEAPGSAA